jgi:3'-5' exoribonuclease 1
MKTKTFIVFDLEATCYDRADTSETKPAGFQNEIIEIGAVKLDQDGNQIDVFSHFLKPKKFKHISNFCTSLTTIVQSDVDNAEPAEEVLNDFFEWAGDAMFVSWGHYDRNQLRDDLKLNKMDVDFITEDNHRSLKHLHAEWNKLKKGMGLGGAIKFEKLTFDGTPHRGIDDAINIAKIFRKYIDRF